MFNLTNIKKLQTNGKVIGFTASTFDLLHPGHLSMLAEAKANCDYLIVAILTDPTNDRSDVKNKPLQTMFERWIQVQALRDVDMIVPFDNEIDLNNMLLTILPDIRFVGEEYRNIEHTGKNIKEIQLYYNKRRHSYSSTELRNRILK